MDADAMATDLCSPFSPVTTPRSLPEALRMRSEQQPDDTAYVFLCDGETPGDALTYRQLSEAVSLRATWFRSTGFGGERAMLLYPSGLEFVSTLIGCMCADVVAVPAQVPTRRRSLQRLRRIADDAGTTTVLTTGPVRSDLLERFAGTPELAGLNLIDSESAVAGQTDGLGLDTPTEGIALLQYTSGSSGDPKGVIVTHDNFRSNVAELVELWPPGPDGTVVSWLPLFHDMGLLFGVVLPLWTGTRSCLMPPESFIRDPLRWLRAISRLGGTHAGAPSFAYELCVRAAEARGLPADIDLSGWRVAVNGAEPVRWHTIERFTEAYAPAGFRPEAMCPGYGLAENTLKASGCPEDRKPTVLWLPAEDLAAGRVDPLAAPAKDTGPGAAKTIPLVGCGVTATTTRVRIVDPETLLACPDRQVGEIWIKGPCVAAGYYHRPAESAATFRARIADRPADGTWLRTGDLGFLHDGELFATGRLKDVIIRQGRNYYPQDIELSAERADSALRPNCAVAFSVDDGTKELLIVVLEVDGGRLRDGGEDLRQRIRDGVWEAQRLAVDEVVLTRHGSLPKTSSGKVQRRATRQRYLAGEFSSLGWRAVRERSPTGGTSCTELLALTYASRFRLNPKEV
jgi:long-chain fatty acid adenylase/transferase FadD26